MTSPLRYYILTLLLIPLSFSITQCGGEKGVSSQVEFNNDPEKPVVINTDFTLQKDDGDGDPNTFSEEVITAPWFLFGYDIKNKSSKTITIVNFKIKVTGKKGGAPVVVETSLKLDDLGDNVTYLEEIAPGKSATTFNTRRWFINSLPKDVDSYNYNVVVEVQGWVGKATEPEDRLTASWTFSTQ